MNKSELSHIADGDIKCTATLENGLAASQQVKVLLFDPDMTLLSKRNENICPYKNLHHNSIIHNNQELETIQILRMDTLNVVYIHTREYF